MGRVSVLYAFILEDFWIKIALNALFKIACI